MIRATMTPRLRRCALALAALGFAHAASAALFDDEEARRRIEATNARLAQETRTVEAELGDGGRVLIRPSGTEPLLRVMVEARDAAVAQSSAERLVEAVQAG